MEGLQMKKLKSFLKRTPSNWVNFVLLVLAIIGLVISFIFDALPNRFSLQIISAMFVFIAIQNFVKQFTHLEEISLKLSSLKPANDTDFVKLKTRREIKTVVESIKEAKHGLFVSGFSLSQWNDYAEDLKSKSNIEIRLLVLDIDNPDLVKTYKDIRRRPANTTPEARDLFLQNFKDCEHIEVKKLCFPMVVGFVGIDMDKQYGYIKAEHSMNSEDNIKLPNIELYPNNEIWYNIYKKQIDYLWSAGVPYF
jgi:hypothetical protein